MSLKLSRRRSTSYSQKPVDLHRLKKYIEHCEKCVAAFIRGFADSERCANKRGYIFILNTDQRLLIYVKELLRRLGIESTGPKLHYLRGTVIHDPRTGKQYTHNKDAYVIYIRASSNMNFYRYVGFAMTRKQARLENYVKRTTGAPTLPQPFPNPSSK
jgi:intein-encoded DNA endonuclease-like protein